MVRSYKLATSLSLAAFALGVAPATASLVDFRSTADGALIGGGQYAPPPTDNGYKVSWNISQNMDSSWHYEYTFTEQDNDNLSPATSHIIIQLSENITERDIYNVGGDVEEATFGTFGPAPSNPGFPGGESIFGIKFDLDGDQRTVTFDSTRQPMWGDFYAKGGSSSFVYNADLGVDVANANDYNAVPIDANGGSLSKILVPDTIPEPTSMMLLALAGAAFASRRRA